MTKYLDETGLRTLWTKIKGTFVAQTIKKSDSSNATQITHDGDTVSLSRGTISGTGNTSTYTKESSTDIIGNNIIFTALNRPSFKTSSDGTPVNLVLKSDLIIAGTNDLGLVKSTTTGKTANRDYYVEVDPKYGTMKVNVPWTDNNTTYSIATSSTPGLVKLGNDEVQTIAANGVTKTVSRTYAVQKNSSNQLVVNVPWTDTKTTIDTALSSISTNPVQNRVINAALSSTNTIVSSHTTAISTLESYFDNEGSALYAVNDEDGHSIIATYATKDELNTFKGLKGQPNGLATLDSNGKVPSSQLPSYVDDVIEGYYYNGKFYKESSHTTEIAGESGKIYTDLGNNKTYRWSGTTYTEISASLALGETSSTAYPGNKGKANAANIKTNTTNITTLKDYFTNGVAKQAAADGDGNNIVDTYATKFALSSTNSDVGRNTTDIAALQRKFNEDGYANVAVKAIADGNGDNIVNTYAKKSDLASVAQRKADLSNGNNFTGNQSITGDLSVTSSSGAGKITIKGDSSHHPGGVVLQTTATSITTANTITIPAKTGTMALTSDIKTYSNGTGLNLSGTTFSLNTNYVATKTANGLMSAADKTKLDNIESISTDYINALS